MPCLNSVRLRVSVPSMKRSLHVKGIADHEAYSLFFKMTPEQDAADRGNRIKQIGRWHDMARGRGVVICECDSAEALTNWALNWNVLLDAEVVPVLDDAEVRVTATGDVEQLLSTGRRDAFFDSRARGLELARARERHADRVRRVRHRRRRRPAILG